MSITQKAQRKTLAIEDPNVGADLPEQPRVDEVEAETHPGKVALFGNDGWLGEEAEHLDPERVTRDYGGYRPAIGPFADPAVRHRHQTGDTEPGLDAQDARWDDEGRN